MTGMVFGRLTLVELTDRYRGGRRIWIVRCECGNTSESTAGDMSSGNTRSCGCLRAELYGTYSRTHGLSKTPTYKIWRGMISRCHNPNDTGYHKYGGRGIKVCARWRHNFVAFLNDMGERPDGLTLDRINNNGPYSPKNCRWATLKEQMANQRPRRIQLRCKRDLHDLTPDNVRLSTSGRRYCRECNNAYRRQRYAEKKKARKVKP